MLDKESSLHDDFSRGIAPRLIRPKANRQLTAELRSKSDLQYLQQKRAQTEHTGDVNFSWEDNNNLLCSTLPVGHRLNSKFRTSIRNGIVDVWWLFEDGGLTLLLSYLLTTQNTYLPVRFFDFILFLINLEF